MLSLNVISVYDRPLDEYMANYKYDMEGTAAQNICLLDKGVVRNYLTDRNTAVRLKQKSNGHFLSADFLVENADGENVGIDPEPRISNLFVESHTDITLEQIKEVIFEQSDWYLEVESRNGQVFVETGTFDMMADNVTRVYKDGRRESVSAGVLSSNLTDFLASIQIVSNQYGESKGFCGSQSGYVPTHERAPAMLLYGINFVTDPKPEKSLEIDLSRDKFIPESFKV
jgi:TldD protein